ncbi:hypothetical protein [Rosistilla oblonga]|uniref:Uncharacterized protein n=1 Tax=Rosistilla oblonga TaxID=2527990 RepID=A0A518IQV5_9BACT|nr:hypothetical protein [Rosistilla oblonga]QDV55476.1 hypothetical protein Mal33_14510 [Rosistilla oblonga]
MSKATIPNTDDYGCHVDRDPLLVYIPLVLIWNGHDLTWHPETMDLQAAERLVTSINIHPGCFAKVVMVNMVVPAAAEIAKHLDAESFEHDLLMADWVRLGLRVERDPPVVDRERPRVPFVPNVFPAAGHAGSEVTQ